MSLYTMKLSDSVDTMEFNLLEVPIQDKDIEGAVDNVVLSGDIYTDFLWLKKRFTHKWSILCKDDYERLRGFYTRQFSNAEVPIYQLLDAPSPVEESAGSGEYIQITTTDSTAKLASVEMLGNATQTTYSGQQLYNYTDLRTTGAYLVVGNDGWYTLTGDRTGESSGSYYSFSTYNLALDYSTSYAIVTEIASVSITGTASITPVDRWGQFDTALTYNSPAVGTYVGTRTTKAEWGSSEGLVSNVFVGAGSKATIKFRISVIADTSVTPSTFAYEPYVGGTASPNPDYPQPISVVTGENVVKIEGKNLFDLQASTRTDAGVVFTKTTDTITAIGTTTRGTHAESLSIYDNFSGLGNYPSYATTTATNSFQLPAGTYTFSANITNTGNTTGGLNIGVGTLGARVSTSTKLEKTAGQSGTASATISVAEGQYILLSVWYDGTANTPNVNLSINQVQLEKGNSASQFEPYQGQEFEVNLGKNLFDTDTAVTRFENIGGSQMNDWGTYQDGIVTIVKSNGAHGTCAFAGFKPTLVEGETYTLSATVRLSGTNATNQIRFGIVQNSPNMSVSGKDVWLDVSKTFVATATDVSDSRVDIQAANTGNIVEIKNIQLEKGSQTSYAPYFTPIELAKIGDYQDRIYKSDGKWYIEKQVGKVVLDGSESWSSHGVGTNSYRTEVDGLALYPTSQPLVMADHFYGIAYDNRTRSGQYLLYSEADAINRLTLRNTTWTSASDLTTWLTSHPTTVYYALVTPTTTEITNEALIAQLDALGAASLFVGVNDIGTETLNAVPTLALTYFPYYPHEIISPKAVRMELTDGGIINACECRENVQITLRETIQ